MSTPTTYDASATTLKPYLQLPHLLSLTWLAYPILSLMFVIFRLELSLSSAQEAIENAKDDLLAACLAAEKAATAAASMPRFLATATNHQFADAVNGSLKGARAGLILALTVMEAIINFIVDTYRSTFLCFVELVVRGGLSLLIGATQEINNAVQSAANGIRTSIQSDVASANSAVKSAFDAINKVNPFGNISPPQFNIPSLSALENITLPTDFQDSLVKLNSSLPSFVELKQKLDAVLDTPFELLKQDINSTFTNFHFDSAILPVPEQNTLTFCSSAKATNLFDELAKDLVKAARIGTVILITIVLLMIAGNCVLEWYRWRCLQRHLRRTREAWVSDPTVTYSGPADAPVISMSDHNLMVLRATSAHPLITRIVNTIASKLRLTPSQYTSLQWFFHYVFHPPALSCFLIGFLGILSVQLQLLALKPLDAKLSHQAQGAIDDFSTLIAGKINESMFNQSSVYAAAINGRVDTLQNDINNNVFGWVNGTTTTLNNTLVEFYNDVQSIVGTVFNGTFLESPAQDFVKCILGSKVDALETALTFLHNNLLIDMPRINVTALVLSPAQVQEATRPIALAAIGSGNSDDSKHQGLLGRLINSYKASLIKERRMFFIFVGLWGIVVLMALSVIFWHSYLKGWIEGRRKQKYLKEQRGGIDDVVVPFREINNEAQNGAAPPLQSHWTGSTQVYDRFHTLSSDHERQQELKEKKSWDDETFFQSSENPPVMISKPSRLLSFSKFNDAHEANQLKKERKMREKAGTDLEGGGEEVKMSWLGRALTVFRKKGSDADNDAALPPKGKNLHDLKIEVDVVDDALHSAAPKEPGVLNVNAHHPGSRWSLSPNEQAFRPPKHVAPPPSRRMTPPGLPLPSNQALPPNGLLSPAPKHRASAPLSVRPSNEAIAESVRNGSNVPLHHAFAVPPPKSKSNERSANTGSPSPDEEAPMRLASPPTRFMPLPPPPPPRSPFRPPSNPNFAMVNGYKGEDRQPEQELPSPGPASMTPLTRMLSSMHARKSSNVNPFATPFDDEWRARDSGVRDSKSGGFAY